MPLHMQRFFYSALYYLLTPLLFLRLLFKHRNSNAYKGERQSLRLAERLGLFKKPDFIADARLSSEKELHRPV